jgi:hypothetical protein
VDHRTDVWAVGMILAELVLGRHPLAPLSLKMLAPLGWLEVPMPSLRELCPELGKLASIIDRCLIKRMEDRLGSARELLAELEALAPAALPLSGDEERNPYAGLAAFREGDASRFFGRTETITEVIAQVSEQPLLAIVGTSGAGKSSFVRAGVIPALDRSADAWEAFTIRPGPRPLAALAELLLSDAFQSSSQDAATAAYGTGAPTIEDRDGLAAKLRAEPGFLGARLRAFSRRRLKRVLLFVDQIEELYTLAREEDHAAFFSCISGVADDVGSPLRVVDRQLLAHAFTKLVDARRVVKRLEHRGPAGHTPEQTHALPLRRAFGCRLEPGVHRLRVGRRNLQLIGHRAAGLERAAQDALADTVKAVSHRSLHGRQAGNS